MKLHVSRSAVAVLLTLTLAGGLLGQAASDSQGQTRVTNGRSAVRVWEEQVTIPTYLIGPPEPNPQFYFGGASQGAQQRIYPYPAYDNLTTEKVDKPYRMVYLENEYLKVGILPESGGKIFEAIDKTNGYNFFYRQHVIKPALISLLARGSPAASSGMSRIITGPPPSSPSSTPSRKRPTVPEPSGSASSSCATACAGPSASRCIPAGPIWRPPSAWSIARRCPRRCCVSPTWPST